MRRAAFSALFSAALATTGALALSACGHSGDAGAASTDNVEMPAEEALSGATAAPVSDAGANAETAASQADTSLEAAARAAQGAASDATGNAPPADAASN